MIKTAQLVIEDGTKMVILLACIEAFWWHPTDHSAAVYMRSGHEFELAQEEAEALQDAWLTYLGDYHSASLQH